MGLGDFLSALFKQGSEEINQEKDAKQETAISEEKSKKPSLERGRSDLEDNIGEDDQEQFSEYFGGEIYTETMADLYMSQGLYAQASEVFEKLLEKDKDNEALRSKLRRARAYILSEKAGLK